MIERSGRVWPSLHCSHAEHGSARRPNYGGLGPDNAERGVAVAVIDEGTAYRLPAPEYDPALV